MPLLINVGLNRKASKDFQSVGVSLNLTAELDQGLLSDPPRLQSEIDRIYGQAEEALERQISAMGTEAKQDAQPAHHAALLRPSDHRFHAVAEADLWIVGPHSLENDGTESEERVAYSAAYQAA